MADDYDDQLRSAMGLPTKAEAESQVRAEEAKRQKMIDDQPRRQELKDKYNAIIMPIVNQVLTRTNVLLRPKGAEFSTVHYIGDRFGKDVLFESGYSICPPGKPLSKTVRVVLFIDGRLEIIVEHVPFGKISFDDTDIVKKLEAAFLRAVSQAYSSDKIAG